jgi:hypothetical protein
MNNQKSLYQQVKLSVGLCVFLAIILIYSWSRDFRKNSDNSL